MSLQTFNETILPIRDKLYRFALRILGNTQEAEDVVQEVFIKVWKKRNEWHTWSNMEAMCMTMTRNLSIDRTRGKHRRLTSLPENYDAVSKSANPEQIVASNDTVDHIRRLIDLLPNKQKMVVQLRDIEGYSYKEVAEILGMSLNQVKINLHRARIFLKEKLIKAKSYGL